MHQGDCDGKRDSKGMLWSWNDTFLGSRDRLICNGNHRCVACAGCPISPLDWSKPSVQLGTERYFDKGAQRFNFVNLLDHPGFYFIMNEKGKCVSVKENTNKTGAILWFYHCDPSAAGQRWKWHHK